MSSEKLSEAVIDFANDLEAACVKLRRYIGEQHGVLAVNEGTFTVLKFEKQHGNKIGDFEVAYKASNIPEKFERAHNVLEKNNATISNRYFGDGYAFSYWLYGEGKIYRQALKAK